MNASKAWMEIDSKGVRDITPTAEMRSMEGGSWEEDHHHSTLKRWDAHRTGGRYAGAPSWHWQLILKVEG